MNNDNDFENDNDECKGGGFDAPVVNDAMEKAQARQKEKDMKFVTNVLAFLGRMRDIPENEWREGEDLDVQSMSYYLLQMYVHEDLRGESEKQYPPLDPDMREYMRKQGARHKIFLRKVAIKRGSIKFAKISTFVIGILTVVTIMTQMISVFGFGYNLLGNFADWGKGVLGISKNVTVVHNDVTVIRNGKTSVYNNVEDAIKDLDLDLLYPYYLPDKTYIMHILYTEKDRIIFFEFNDENFSITIELFAESVINFDNAVQIGNYTCDVTTDGAYYEASFVDKTHIYNFKASNYEAICKTIENLKYIQ